MNIKKATKSELLTTESKKLSKQEQEKNHRHGDHLEGYPAGRGRAENGRKGTGIKKQN